MVSLKVKIKSRATYSSRKFQIEVDADRFEKLAADFGLFNPAFLRSLETADRDHKAGRVKKLKSLRQLRSRKHA